MAIPADPAAERADAKRVGEAVARERAAAGATPAEARAETSQAVADATSLSDQDCDRIADRLVQRFEDRGAFEQSGTALTPETDLPPAAETGQAERQVAGESGEGPPPRKYKPAERFMGRHRSGA